MKSDPKQLINQVLQIIGYEDDKDKYTNGFLELCYQKALVGLVDKLPEEKQEQLNQRFSLTPVEKRGKLFEEYFSKEEVEEAVKNASKDTFEEFIKAIEPTLNDDQRKKLVEYLESIEKPPVIV